MTKFPLLLLACAGLLSACANPMLGVVPTAPAPLAATTVDEKALLVALATADAAATSVDALVATGVIVPGTPRALAVKKALVALRAGLSAASAAQRAGSTASYAEAVREAGRAAAEVTQLLSTLRK